MADSSIRTFLSHGRTVVDLTGHRFGRLTVVGPQHINGELLWLCECDCGDSAICSYTNIIGGKHVSCGCLKRERAAQLKLTHGGRYTREYTSWKLAKSRCYNANNPGYPNYGGRGITVCDEWRCDFAVFLRDMGPCPKGHSIDRIDNDGNYSKENCRWATHTQQMNNQRKNTCLTFDGETLTVPEWAERLGISRLTIHSRLQRQWSVEDALQMPTTRGAARPLRRHKGET